MGKYVCRNPKDNHFFGARSQRKAIPTVGIVSSFHEPERSQRAQSKLLRSLIKPETTQIYFPEIETISRLIAGLGTFVTSEPRKPRPRAW